jgi:hypothetical protein
MLPRLNTHLVHNDEYTSHCYQTNVITITSTTTLININIFQNNFEYVMPKACISCDEQATSL